MIAALALNHVALADVGATHTSLVAQFASANTPGTVDGRVEAIAIDGDTVYVGGRFTQIHDPQSDEIIDQPYLFAYSKSTGKIIRDFDPVLNDHVYALETIGNGEGVFAGGRFTNFGGAVNRRALVKLDNQGERISGFSARPDGRINTMVRLGNTLYIGGRFSKIASTSIERLAAVDVATGEVLPTFNLDFDGRLTTEVAPNAVQSVDDIDITSDGKLMVVVGNFEGIDNISRPRLAVIELDGQARVSNWNTDVYDNQCPRLVPQQIRGIDIAPDNAYFLVGSQGFRERGNPACSAISRFDFGDLSNPDVQPTWVNYTGGDSVYDVVSTDHVIYAGGHFRWLNNDATDIGDTQAPGSLVRAGLAAIDPINGLTLPDWISDRNPRGVGVFALIAEPEGIYIGDDTDFLNGIRHPKLKFLPITSDKIVRPAIPSMPTTLFSPSDMALVGTDYDGSTFGPTTELQSSGWANARAGMMAAGQLFHADDEGSLWVSQFSNGALEERTSVELYGLTSNEWRISELTGMFFDYEQGRIYYTLQDDSQLYWRAFSPDGPYVSNDQFVAENQGDILWSDVSGMDVIDGSLYFTRTNGSLYRASINGASVISGTTQIISGPDIDGRNWDNELLAFRSEGVRIEVNNNTVINDQVTSAIPTSRVSAGVVSPLWLLFLILIRRCNIVGLMRSS